MRVAARALEPELELVVEKWRIMPPSGLSVSQHRGKRVGRQIVPWNSLLPGLLFLHRQCRAVE